MGRGLLPVPLCALLRHAGVGSRDERASRYRAGVGIGRLLRLPRVFVSPATRWLACTGWADTPTVVGDAWGGIIRGSSFLESLE